MSSDTPTEHASAVLVGARAVLIRGLAGTGKSRLVLGLLDAAQTGLLRFARLVGDDRVVLEAHHGRLLVRPAPALAGLLEIRGVGIRRLPYEPLALVGLVVDFTEREGERLPEASEQEADIAGVCLPRLAVAGDALPRLLAVLRTAAA